MNYQTLEQLIQTFKDDSELLQAIKDAFDSFEAYHAAIYSMETRKKILIHTADTQNYQEEITAMDRKRTACHNAVLANVSMLNRMADMAGLPPVYEGVISEDQPYRRQVADAVLEYVHKIVRERP